MRECDIVLADDHAVVREGLKSLIGRRPGFRVVGEAGNGLELLAVLAATPCDLAVVDIAMPEMDGLTALKEIGRRHPGLKVLVLSMYVDFEHFKQAKSRGAAGYLDKNEAVGGLVPAIEAVLAGRFFVSPSVNALLADRQVRSMESGDNPSLEILTRRERQVLVWIAKGLANKNIAERMKISIHTVENHRAHLSAKLGLKNTVALVKYAIAKGLV